MVDTRGNQNGDMRSWLETKLEAIKKVDDEKGSKKVLLFNTLWLIWKTRNWLILKDKKVNHELTIRLAEKNTWDYLLSNEENTWDYFLSNESCIFLLGVVVAH